MPHPGFEEFPPYASPVNQRGAAPPDSTRGARVAVGLNSSYQQSSPRESRTSTAAVDSKEVQQSFQDIHRYLNGGYIHTRNREAGGGPIPLGSVVGADTLAPLPVPPPTSKMEQVTKQLFAKVVEKDGGATPPDGAVDPMSKSPRRLSRRRPPPLSPEKPAAPEVPALNLTDESRTAYLQVVWYLRRRYGDKDPKLNLTDSQELHPGRQDLTALSDDDIDDLAACFAEELKTVAKKQRVKKGIPDPAPRKVSEEEMLRSKLRSMTVRDAIAELRTGEMFTKFGRKGTPSIRFLRVLDRRTLHNGEMVAMPHLCWSVDSHSEPSGQLPLFELREIQTGPSETMKKNAEGFVVGCLKEELRDAQCFTLVFATRSVDLGCKHPDRLQIWKRAAALIVQKNREMMIAQQRSSR